MGARVVFTIDDTSVGILVPAGDDPSSAFVQDGWLLDPTLALIESALVTDGGDFADGRLGVHTCYCGDLGCGAISARVVRHGDLVEWRNLAYQNLYDDQAIPVDAPTFEFSATQYDEVFRLLRQRIEVGVVRQAIGKRWRRQSETQARISLGSE